MLRRISLIASLCCCMIHSRIGERMARETPGDGAVSKGKEGWPNLMDERVRRLTTVKECEQFILNVKEKWPDLVKEARRKVVELRAAEHGAKTEAEREALRAVYAYEEARSAKNGRKTHATRTWRMVKQRGILSAVDRLVSKKKETMGYETLVEMGMQDFAFEAVVLRYPKLFSQKARERSKARIGEAEGR